jgi:hypothetical protein
MHYHSSSALGQAGVAFSALHSVYLQPKKGGYFHWIWVGSVSILNMVKIDNTNTPARN